MTHHELKKSFLKSRENFIEKISVAGWKEAFGEHVVWISHIFKIALITLSVFSFYHISIGIRQWLRSGYKNDISEHFDEKSLAASNVTICAQVYFNETYVRENVYVPNEIKNKIENRSIGEFYHQLTLFLSIISRPPQIDPIYLYSFVKILRLNPHVGNYSVFASEALASCEKMFERCWFDGQEFDCCSRAVRSIDEDGICYVLALNHDSDNAAHSGKTLRQTRPGPEGGLTVRMNLKTDHFPWADRDTDNGFRVYVNPVPYSMFQSPLGAPDRAETFIKVTPSKQVSSTNCASHNRLAMKGGEFMYYDPEGLGCIMREFGRAIREITGCEGPTYLHRPNASTVCGPRMIFAAEIVFANENAESKIKQVFGSKIFGVSEDALIKRIQFAEDKVKHALSEKARCPSHCQYWTYSSSASFFYLEKNDTEHENDMKSKIHVYYGDLDYRQYERVAEIPFYLWLCDFGNTAGFWWGMSMVSFLHVAYYVPIYLYWMWKLNREGSGGLIRVRNVRVVPIE